MKIYYLKYYKGNIAVEEMNIDDRFFNGSYRVIHGIMFNAEDEGEVIEYSLGDIRIWIAEKDDFELAYKKLNNYVENFHHKNIKMYRERVEQEGEYLSALYEESMDAYLDGVYKYYNINKKEK